MKYILLIFLDETHHYSNLFIMKFENLIQAEVLKIFEKL